MIHLKYLAAKQRLFLRTIGGYGIVFLVVYVTKCTRYE